MDNTTRLQYLEAMGIDVWLSRTLTNEQSDPTVLGEVADNWESLEAEVAQCTRCSLGDNSNQTFFGSGNKNADWMLVSVAIDQLSSTDKAGLLLTEMLRAIELDREDVFITHAVKCRPSDNRPPKFNEIESCKTYLARQQALIKPKIILALGSVAAQSLLDTDEPIDALRGKAHTLNDTPVVISYHPEDLLKSSLDKRKAWTDLKLAIQIIRKIKG